MVRRQNIPQTKHSNPLTSDSALAWLEYCNGNGDTHYANLRRQNGHEEPYNVTSSLQHFPHHLHAKLLATGQILGPR